MPVFQLNNWGGAMQSWETFCAADPTTLMTAPPGGGLDVVDVLDRLCSINFTQLVTEANAYQGLDRLNALVSLCGLLLALTVYTPAHQLRSSSDTSIRCLPSVWIHSLGQIFPPDAALSVWSSFPCRLRSSNTLTSFKSSFKSHLFKL